MLSLIDFLPQRPSGHLRLEVFRGGELIEVFEEKNLVVDGYKNTHARLIGGDTTDFCVTQFAVGTNGAAPAPGNTALTSPFAKGVDSVSYPAPGQVCYGISLYSGEANGKDILEFGLLTSGGVLYARRVRSLVLAKTSDVSIVGAWTITF